MLIQSMRINRYLHLSYVALIFYTDILHVTCRLCHLSPIALRRVDLISHEQAASNRSSAIDPDIVNERGLE